MNSKPVLKSKTIYGIAILILPNVLRLCDGWFGTQMANAEIDNICMTLGGYLAVKGRADAAPLTIK